MTLSGQVITGSLTALNLIKNYLDNPSLSPQDIYSTLPFPNSLKTVAFQCESYKETLESDLSQQLIIDASQGKKQYITDNIAPKPRIWDVKGYIAAAPWELIASPVLQLTQAKKVANLREMRDSREMLVWRTRNGTEYVFVGIKSLIIDSRPEVQNRVPVSLILQEIPILAYTKTGLGVPFGTNNPSAMTDVIGQKLAIVMPLAAMSAAISSTAFSEKGQEEDVSAAINVPQNRTVKTYYKIDLPTTTPGVNFSFLASVGNQSFNITFKWTDRWSLTVTMPDGSIRSAGLYPNVMNWTGYTDYGMVGYTSLDTIGYADLPKVSLFVVAWNE